MFELRILLELEALKTTIKKITNEELDVIEKSFLNLDSNSSKEDYYSSDRNLHKIIMKYSGNSRMIDVHKMMDSPA